MGIVGIFWQLLVCIILPHMSQTLVQQPVKCTISKLLLLLLLLLLAYISINLLHVVTCAYAHKQQIMHSSCTRATVLVSHTICYIYHDQCQEVHELKDRLKFVPWPRSIMNVCLCRLLIVCA